MQASKRSLEILVAVALLLTACGVDEDGGSGAADAGTDRTHSIFGDADEEPDLGQPDSGESDLGGEDQDGGADAAADIGSDWQPGPLELRSRDEVCGRWNADRVLDREMAWTPGANECDPGQLHADAIADALRYVNLYRWLNDLAEVADADELNGKAQLCAVIMDGLDDITHDVPGDAPCHTADGSEAAANSNLALGPRHPAEAVDLYMVDNGVPNLGHRRWILNPSYGSAGFGQVGRFSCQWVIDFSGNGGQPRYFTFPNPGWAPLTERPVWSFSIGSVDFDAGTTIEVVDVASGTVLNVDQYTPDPPFGPESLAFTPEGWEFERTYEVRVQDAIEGGERTTIIYRTTPTRCL